MRLASYMKIGIFVLIIWKLSIISSIAKEKTVTNTIKVKNGDVQIIDINPTMLNTFNFNFDVQIIASDNVDITIVGRRAFINKINSKYETIVATSKNGKVAITILLKSSNVVPVNINFELDKIDLVKTLPENNDFESNSYVDTLVSVFKSFQSETKGYTPEKIKGEVIVITDNIVASEVIGKVIDNFMITKYQIINVGKTPESITENQLYFNKNVRAVIFPTDEVLYQNSQLVVIPDNRLFVYVVSSATTEAD